MKKVIWVLLAIVVLVCVFGNRSGKSQSNEVKTSDNSIIAQSESKSPTDEEYRKMIDDILSDVSLNYYVSYPQLGYEEWFLNEKNSTVISYYREHSKRTGKITREGISTYTLVGEIKTGWTYGFASDLNEIYNYDKDANTVVKKSEEGKVVSTYNACDGEISFRGIKEYLDKQSPRRAYEMLLPKS